MAERRDDLDVLIDAMSGVVNLSIDEEFRPGVRTYLAIARDMAAMLDTVTLADDELVLAPVYTPPERPE